MTSYLPRSFEADELTALVPTAPYLVWINGRAFRIVDRAKVLTWDRKGVAYEYVVERAGNAD
jgi:hypothetical protein